MAGFRHRTNTGAVENWALCRTGHDVAAPVVSAELCEPTVTLCSSNPGIVLPLAWVHRTQGGHFGFEVPVTTLYVRSWWPRTPAVSPLFASYEVSISALPCVPCQICLTMSPEVMKPTGHGLSPGHLWATKHLCFFLVVYLSFFLLCFLLLQWKADQLKHSVGNQYFFFSRKCISIGLFSWLGAI